MFKTPFGSLCKHGRQILWLWPEGESRSQGCWQQPRTGTALKGLGNGCVLSGIKKGKNALLLSWGEEKGLIWERFRRIRKLHCRGLILYLFIIFFSLTISDCNRDICSNESTCRTYMLRLSPTFKNTISFETNFKIGTQFIRKRSASSAVFAMGIYTAL